MLKLKQLEGNVTHLRAPGLSVPYNGVGAASAAVYDCYFRDCDLGSDLPDFRDLIKILVATNEDLFPATSSETVPIDIGQPRVVRSKWLHDARLSCAAVAILASLFSHSNWGKHV